VAVLVDGTVVGKAANTENSILKKKTPSGVAFSSAIRGEEYKG